MINKKLELYFEWDAMVWGQSLTLWTEKLNANRGGKLLEIGSRRGTLALMFAKEFDINVVCSDLRGPDPSAKVLHQENSVLHKMDYVVADCMQLPYREGEFDVIVFKSVIGALSTFANQQKAIKEIHRVLKPGGVLLFAENKAASKLHMLLRKKLVKWSTYWRYLTTKDIKELLVDFKEVKVKSNGFLSVFIPEGRLKQVAAKVDGIACVIVPETWKYMSYGYAIK